MNSKIGYGLGDMASCMFWKIFFTYLPFFYSAIYGLTLVDATLLMLVIRVWDAVSDPIMGIVADRTSSKWGRYRPYLLWGAVPFGIAGVLLFTVPDFSYEGKRLWAYLTYFFMMTVYKFINVPYGAMLGVITSDSEEKTVFSSYRMFFAYAGGFLILAIWEPLCRFFNLVRGIDKSALDAGSWRCSMALISAICVLLFLLCFSFTKETIVKENKKTSVKADFIGLIKNVPWWILLFVVLFFNLFGAIRYTIGPFYFASLVGEGAVIRLFSFEFLFYAGLFFAVGEFANMLGVSLTPYVTRRIGKKSTFVVVLLGMCVFSLLFFFIPINNVGYWLMIICQILISFIAGVASPLVWSMFADVADYSEWKYGISSTAFIFSSSSMAQKLGGAFGGTIAMALLALFGYDIDMGATQSEFALLGVKSMMSLIPAISLVLALAAVLIYPLDTMKMRFIQEQLRCSCASCEKNTL